MSIISHTMSGQRAQGKLEQFFAKAIPALAEQNSAHLGVRSAFDTNGNFTGYFGGSDHCPRKAVLSRLNPVEHSLETQLRFTWGHLAQELFSRLFEAGGLKFQEEVEIAHPDHPIKVHIDFLFKAKMADGRTRWHVVEKKATDQIPDEPHGSWVDQLQLQMGLLKRFHPDIKEDDVIGGSILASKPLSKEHTSRMLNGVREFNSFVPNDLVYEAEINKRLHMVQAVNGLCDPRCEPGFICAGFCPYYGDCPAYQAKRVDLSKEVISLAHTYARLSEQKRQLEKQIKEKKEQLLGFTGEKFNGEDNQRCIRIKAYVTKDSVSLDSDLLKQKYPEIYKEVCTKTRAGSQRLDVDVIDEEVLTHIFAEEGNLIPAFI